MSLLVLVLLQFKFGTKWYGSCRQITYLLSELSKNYDGKAIIGNVDTNDSPDLASKFAIRGIPTIIVFKDGEEMSRETGALNLQQLSSKIDNI